MVWLSQDSYQLESENEDDNDATNEEEWASSTETKSDASDNEDAIAAAEAHLKKVKAAVIRKLVPYNVGEFEKVSMYSWLLFYSNRVFSFMSWLW